MSNISQDNLARDAQFLQRVRVAMVSTAIAVQSELNTTPNHTNRSNYAKLVLNSPDSYVLDFSEATVSNAAITAASLDSDIQFQVNSVWNALAGVI